MDWSAVSACLTLPLLVLPALPCRGTEATPSRDGSLQWLQTHWQSEQGLPSNTVQAIVQTKDGYLWIGSKRGLVRFDGVRFKVFQGSELHGLSDRSVSALCETGDGTLWIGGERGGVARLKGGKFSAAGLSRGVTGRWVQNMKASRSSDLLIRSFGRVISVEGNKSVAFMPTPGMQDDIVSAMLEDRSGKLWLSYSKSGLIRCDDIACSSFKRFGALPIRRVNQIYQDRSGDMWLGANGALVRYDGERFKIFRFDNETAFNEVYTIVEDLDGGIWAGAWGRVVRLKNDRFTVLELKDGGKNNEVLALAVDHENNVWVGTRNYGLYRLNQARLVTYTKSHGLSNESVKSVLVDSKGQVWVGADAGLNIFEGGRFRVVKGMLSRHNVRSLAEGRDGSIWIGGWDELLRLKDGKLKSFPLNLPGMPAQVTTSLLSARDGSLWAGTRMGLIHLQNGQMTRITTKHGLSSDFIRTILEGRDRSIWVGTSQGGLNRIKDGKISVYTVQNGLASNDVYSLYEDADGVLWIGTMDHGICRWNRGALACFSAADGLFEDGAYQILEDRRGHLWIGGAGGIYRVAKSQLEERARGVRPRISYVSFGASDGMPSVECRGGHQPACGKTADGRLWFTTIRGLVAVDPERLRSYSISPPVVIEEVTVNETVLEGSGEETPLGDGKVEFKYTGLSLIAPSKVDFKHRLSDFDRDWVAAGSRRVATYTNLPPGRYVFQVMASNSDGVWNTKGASFEVTLRPPYYRSNWFLTLCALTLAGLIYGAHRSWAKSMELRFEAVLAERTRIAREMHDTILQGMAGISSQLEAVSGMLLESPATARAHLERVRVQARSVVEEARRSIWNLRPQTLEGGSLVNALQKSARELLEGSSVQFHLELAGQPWPLSLHVEKNLLRIAQEAIANAVQHGRPQRIVICLVFDSQNLRLSVRDDGVGFDPSSPTLLRLEHCGLLGMRERSDQVSGRLSLTSGPGEGTTIQVTVPRMKSRRMKHAS